MPQLDASTPNFNEMNQERRAVYDQIANTTVERGIDLRLFYGNPSYFDPVPWDGSHPALIHWPFEDYPGGEPLLGSLQRQVQAIQACVAEGDVIWVLPEHWHSTIFTPVHSSSPRVIAAANQEIDTFRDICTEGSPLDQVGATRSYSLVFSRIVITPDGGILATAYPSCAEFDDLRARLRAAMPGGRGHYSPFVHITLGHVVHPLDSPTQDRLLAYTRQFGDESKVIGEVEIRHVTFGMYISPFLAMRVEEIFRRTLRP